jgi:Polyketide cyclase / dehydrase and lipid transport
MTIVSHRFETPVSSQKLWHCLSNLDLVKDYNPTITHAEISGPSPTGLGTIRTCALKPKGKVVERVKVWEEGKAVGLEVVESDWPITKMHWVTRITPNGAGSILSQDLEYEMKFGPFGWLLNALVMKRNITKNVGGALQGLIKIAEQQR